MNIVTNPPKRLGDCSILVIDDDADWLAIHEQALGQLGCHMELARDRKDAIRRLEGRRFHLVITNFNLRASFSESNIWYAEITVVLDKIAEQGCPIVMITGANENDFDSMNKIRELREEYTQIVCILPKSEIASFKLRKTVKQVLEEYVLRQLQVGGDAATNRYNISILRTLLRETFGDGVILRRFCDDRGEFRQVIANFGPQYSFAEMVDAVIDYCRMYALFSELLQQVKEFNPGQYARFEHDLYY